MLSTVLRNLGLTRTKRLAASPARPAGEQYERQLGPERLCVFVADDQRSAEIVFGSGSRPRVFGRGPFDSPETLRRFLELHSH